MNNTSVAIVDIIVWFVLRCKPCLASENGTPLHALSLSPSPLHHIVLLCGTGTLLHGCVLIL